MQISWITQLQRCEHSQTKNIKMDRFMGNLACIANSNVDKLFDIKENEKARLD